MNNWLVGMIAVVYAYVGITCLFKGNYGWSIMWVSYAMANVGIIIAGGGE